MRDFVAVLLYLLRAIAAVSIGAVGGWWVSKLLCYGLLPGALCGHNAPITLFFVIPVVGLVGWYLVSPITWAVQREPPNQSRHGGA